MQLDRIIQLVFCNWLCSHKHSTVKSRDYRAIECKHDFHLNPFNQIKWLCFEWFIHVAFILSNIYIYIFEFKHIKINYIQDEKTMFEEEIEILIFLKYGLDVWVETYILQQWFVYSPSGESNVDIDIGYLKYFSNQSHFASHLLLINAIYYDVNLFCVTLFYHLCLYLTWI